MVPISPSENVITISIDWFDPKICQPINGSIVEVLGNPTICCELDMEEEGIYKCIFERKLSTWKPDFSSYTFSEEFYLCEEDRMHMEIIKGWRPINDTNS